MQVYRINAQPTTQNFYRITKAAPSYTNNNNMAAFFPRVFASEFAPVFRLLEDYASTVATRTSHCNPAAFAQPQRSFRQTFQPRFDVRESKESYELLGELPGVEQKDIIIEFTDANTLSIRGRTETVKEEGTRPTAAVEAAQQPETPETIEAAETESTASSSNYHKASVEEEEGVLIDADGNTTVESTPAQTPATEAPQPQTQEAAVQKPTYWISERFIGSFARSFQFPQRVKHDAVKASLRDGILSIVVPKAAKINRSIRIE